MKQWKESQKEVRRVRPDKGMARAILRMIEEAVPKFSE